MPYTPVELRHVKIGRSFRGYNREETERVLDEVADSFENVWRDRGELADKVEDLEKSLAEYKQREHLLTQTLVAAERAAAEARDAARREAELIVAEAHQEARAVTRTAQGERERLVGETRRIETLLRGALGLIEESVAGDVVAPEQWPGRQDTREFEAIAESMTETPADPTAAGEVLLPPPLDDEPSGEDVAPGKDFNWG